MRHDKGSRHLVRHLFLRHPGSPRGIRPGGLRQGWNSFSLGQGPFKVLEFERNARGTETLFGAGIVTLAAAAGALNAGVALWLRGTLLSKQH